MSNRIKLIEPTHKRLSISLQCNLLSVPRSSYYYKPIPENEFNLMLMQEMDKLYLSHPYYGSRSMTACLLKMGYEVNRKRISRLMKLMGIEALYPKPKKKSWLQRYSKFPFLLKNFEYKHPNHVWAIDITYIPVENGFLYLVAIIDVYSRYILTWELSNSLESTFCVDSIEKAFKRGTPLIFNSDKGAQFTSYDYISLLQSRGVQISMSGTGRCWDNIFIERFWRSLKYEEIYLKQYNNPEEAHESIETYILHYNNERPHSALNYNTPTEMYYLKEKK